MEPVLDDDLFDDEEAVDEPKLTNNKLQKVFLYFLVMFFGGILYYILVPQEEFLSEQYLLSAISLIMISMVISTFLEVIRFFIRRMKTKRTNVKIKQDPLWFKIYEGGFSIWILVIILFGINLILNLG